jgi:hypothetical protein
VLSLCRTVPGAQDLVSNRLLPQKSENDDDEKTQRMAAMRDEVRAKKLLQSQPPLDWQRQFLLFSKHEQNKSSVSNLPNPSWNIEDDMHSRGALSASASAPMPNPVFGSGPTLQEMISSNLNKRVKKRTSRVCEDCEGDPDESDGCCVFNRMREVR